jgi:hypothetical protein
MIRDENTLRFHENLKLLDKINRLERNVARLLARCDESEALAQDAEARAIKAERHCGVLTKALERPAFTREQTQLMREVFRFWGNEPAYAHVAESS